MPRDKTVTFYTNDFKPYNTKQLTCNQQFEVLKLFKTTENKDLCKMFNINQGLISSMCNEYYGLKKDKNFINKVKKEILTKRNKENGRDLSKDFIKSCALKYSSKREWSHKDPSSYVTANKLNIMEECTKHMVNISFSVPQIVLKQILEELFNEKCMYNTRRVISPYEIDVYFKKYKIGFEYDGVLWHKNDTVDKESLCRNRGILLLTIKEKSRKYLEDIKKFIIENLDVINEKCSLNISKEDVLLYNEKIEFPKLFSDEELELLRSNDRKFLIKNYYNLYCKYRKYNPDNLTFSHTKWTEDVVKDCINNYKSVKELLRKNIHLYQVIHKRFRHLLPLYENTVK